MNLNKSKSNRKDRGFTIVELLVVIVVIGILAAITIVSYIGFTSRAKTSQAQSNANSAMQVIAAYTGDATVNGGGNGTYPADAGIAAALAGYSLAKLPAGVTLTLQTINKPASIDAAGQVWYKLNTLTTGACIGYWDTAATAAAFLYMGTATIDAPGTATCT